MKILTEGLTLLDFTNDIAKLSAEIFRKLKSDNKLIEFRDIFIAATCLNHNLPLLTHNKSDFSRISNLKLIDL